MTPSPEAQPIPVVDIFDQSLNEGDRIAFTHGNGDGLYTGTIQLIGHDHATREQLVVQSGHLLILKGTHVRLSGGKPEHIRFNQVVLRPTEDGA